MLSVYVLLVIAFASITNASPVVYGRDLAKISDHPYLVHLDITKVVKKKQTVVGCGGTIIGKRTVLTAADCLVGDVTLIQVSAGNTNFHRPKQGLIWQKDGKLLHDSYKSKKSKHLADLGIVWVQKDFNLTDPNSIRVASLPTKAPNPELPVSFMGWGVTEKSDSPNIAQKGSGQLQATCKKLDSLCVHGTNKTTNPCDGDSGGPLVQNGTVIGVLSTIQHSTLLKVKPSTYKKCNGKSANVFTSTFFHLDWIKEHKDALQRPL